MKTFQYSWKLFKLEYLAIVGKQINSMFLTEFTMKALHKAFWSLPQVLF